MYPVTTSTITSTFLIVKPLLLLNTGLQKLEYLKWLVSKTSITTKGGIQLSPELWSRIIKFVSDSSVTCFCWVRPHSVRETPRGLVLKCAKINLNANRNCGELDGEQEVLFYENFISAPDRLESDVDVKIKLDKQLTSKAIDILLRSSDKPDSPAPGFLFSEVEVPDVIAYLEGGRCWVCQGQRSICPGCTGGVAQEFDAFMGCGVSLACPLCMGLDFMHKDKRWLQEYYWEDALEEKHHARQIRIDDRRTELGY